MNKKDHKNILIRYATQKDISFILKGIKEICNIEKEKPESVPFLTKITKKAIRKKEILVAIEDEKVIGFIQYRFEQKDPYGFDYGSYAMRYCWIDWMYVDKKYRRQGIGKILHEKVVSVCKKNKIKEILLDVFEVNAFAKEFYDRERFVSYIHILKERVN